jgi:hypothetical protein
MTDNPCNCSTCTNTNKNRLILAANTNTDKQPEPEYIVTGSQLEDILKMPTNIYAVIDGIHSRPYHPAPEAPCSQKYLDCKVCEDEIRQSEREKSNKIFDHTIALCEALIARFDSQSQLGFNALIIKRAIESLRKVK